MQFEVPIGNPARGGAAQACIELRQGGPCALGELTREGRALIEGGRPAMARKCVLVTGMSGLIGGAVRRELGGKYESAR